MMLCVMLFGVKWLIWGCRVAFATEKPKYFVVSADRNREEAASNESDTLACFNACTVDFYCVDITTKAN